jgi:hypothetical protein
MPSTVSEIYAAAGLAPGGVVTWGEPVPETRPGVYVVALSSDIAAKRAGGAACPIDPDSVVELLRVRPELRLDGSRPTAGELADRLSALWLDDETVVYIGLAGTSVQSRVNAYYRTPLGARSPHAGGWPLKTLSVLSSLWVHYAASTDPSASEQLMLAAFVGSVSSASKSMLLDSNLPVPFANLEKEKGHAKRHGITGSRAPRKPSAAKSVSADDQAQKITAIDTTVGVVESAQTEPRGKTTRTRPTHTPAGPMQSQRITETDMQAGRVRLPSSAKGVFPSEPTDVAITLRGEQMSVPWHPRYDHDQERSGVLSVGRQRLHALVQPDDVLSVSTANGRVLLS